MNYALLLTALFNGAWQGAVLCTAAYFAFQAVRRLNAATMFAVWSALLAIALALPVANYVFAAHPITVHVAAARPLPMPAQPETARVQAANPRSARAPLAEAPPAVSLRERATSAVSALLEHAWIVLLLAAVIAAFRLAVLARDLAGMFAARRAAKRIELPFSTDALARPYEFASSTDLKSPCVLGFSPALIVIPQELLDAPQCELLSVVLHEREHVRRYDDVQNVLFRIVNAVAFFCPGVRLALRELALYREQICDDAAVNGIGDPVTYAMTLTGMAQWAQGRGVPVPSLIFKRKQLLHRLEVLLDRAVNHSLHTNRRFALSACAAIVLAAAIVLHFQVPVIAQVVTPPPKTIAVKTVVLKTVAVNPVAPKAPAKIAPVKPALAPAAPHATPCPLTEKKSVRRPAAAPHSPHVAPPAPIAHVTVIAALAQTQRAMSYATVASYASASSSAPRVADAASSDVLDALQAAGIRNLSVDELIAIRDHGVSPALVRAATGYFGAGLGPNVLTKLADHGVSATYLDQLRANGLTGVAPDSVVMLLDHGVNTQLMRAAYDYFRPAPSAADLTYMTDHGVSASSLELLRRYGINGIPVGDVVRLADRGVPASYVAKVRRMNPRATIDDVIRLHDAGV